MFYISGHQYPMTFLSESMASYASAQPTLKNAKKTKNGTANACRPIIGDQSSSFLTFKKKKYDRM